MAVDLFINETCPIAKQKDSVIDLNVVVGNLGTDPAVGATLAKTVIIPAGVTVEVVDIPGNSIGPAVGDVIAGPAVIGFVVPGINFSAVTPGGFPVFSFDFALKLLATPLLTTTTVTDIGSIIFAGDTNPENNNELCSISIFDF